MNLLLVLSRGVQHGANRLAENLRGFFAALLLLSALFGNQLAYGFGAHEKSPTLVLVPQDVFLCQNLDALHAATNQLGGGVSIQGVRHPARNLAARGLSFSCDCAPSFRRDAHSGLSAYAGIGPVAAARLLRTCNQLLAADAHAGAAIAKAAKVGLTPFVVTKGVAHREASKFSFEYVRHNGAAPEWERKSGGGKPSEVRMPFPSALRSIPLWVRVGQWGDSLVMEALWL